MHMASLCIEWLQKCGRLYKAHVSDTIYAGGGEEYLEIMASLCIEWLQKCGRLYKAHVNDMRKKDT